MVVTPISMTLAFSPHCMTPLNGIHRISRIATPQIAAVKPARKRKTGMLSIKGSYPVINQPAVSGARHSCSLAVSQSD